MFEYPENEEYLNLTNSPQSKIDEKQNISYSDKPLNNNFQQNINYYDLPDVRNSISIFDKKNKIINQNFNNSKEIINSHENSFQTNKDISISSDSNYFNSNENYGLKPENKNSMDIIYNQQPNQNILSSTKNYANNIENKENYFNPNLSNINNIYNKNLPNENDIGQSKTYFNYDDNLEKNGNFFNQNNNQKNIEYKNKSEENENNSNNIVINYKKNYSFGNRDINETQSAHFNIDTIEKENKDNQILNYDKLSDSNDYFFSYKNSDSFRKINVLETKINKKNYDNNSKFIPPENNNISIDNNNIIKKKYNINIQKDFNSNFIDNKNDNSINNDINNNFYDSKNSYNSIDSTKINKVNEEEKQIQVQIKLEEEKLQKLEEEKNKLIKEEKERRIMILEEINRNEMRKIEMHKKYEEAQKQKKIGEEKLNNIKMEQEKRKKEIEQLLRQSKKDEEQLKAINDLKINIEYSNLNELKMRKNNNINNISNNIYYKDNNIKFNFDDNSHKQIQTRNELINKEGLERMNIKNNRVNNIINIKSSRIYNKIENSKNNFIYDNKKILNQTFTPKSIKGNFTFNNYINNEDKINNNNNLYKKNNNFYNNEFNMKNIKNENKSKYNLYSYFQLNNNQKIMNKTNTFYNNIYKENNFIKKIEIENNNFNRKPRSVSLTPNGNYRARVEDNEDLSNIRTDGIENNNNLKFNYNRTYLKSNLCKTISPTNKNYMTQTRFYRAKLNPDQLKSNYAREKVKSINNEKNLSYDLNIYKTDYFKNRFNEENKINHSFYKLENITSKNNINNEFMNNNTNYINDNNKNFNNLLFNNNLNINNQNNFNNNYSFKYNKKKNKRLNTYRTSCTLKKGNSFSNLQKLIGDDNKITNENQTNYHRLFNNYNYNNIKNNIYNIKYDGIYSHLTRKNNFMYNSFHINNNMNHNGNLCDKCMRARLLNEKGKDIDSYNMMLIEKGNNYILKNNNIIKNNISNFCNNCSKMSHLNLIN